MITNNCNSSTPHKIAESSIFRFFLDTQTSLDLHASHKKGHLSYHVDSQQMQNRVTLFNWLLLHCVFLGLSHAYIMLLLLYCGSMLQFFGCISTTSITIIFKEESKPIILLKVNMSSFHSLLTYRIEELALLLFFVFREKNPVICRV